METQRINLELIKKYLKENNLSKKEFYTACNISKTTLNRVLASKDFNMRTMVKIAKGMNIEVEELFKECYLI